MVENPQDPQNPESQSGIKQFIRRLPAAISEIVKGKAAGIADSSRLREERITLDWNEASARTVISEIEDILRRGVTSRSEEETLNDADRALVEEISLATSRAGISNITRTEAYLASYQAYPELHWAFLAHMVSRNAGWNMTDLRGSRVCDILDEETKRTMYRFIERSNALIFQDAYPQLLLYIKSRELGSSRFHLLSYFHVSRFMRPFWERFWIDRGSTLLTVGLIINEQNYIEKRVIRHPYYQKYVTDKAHFHISSITGLNQVVFPLMEDCECVQAGKEDEAANSFSPTSEQEDAASDDEISAEAICQAAYGLLAEGCRGDGEVRRLAGRVVSDFGSLTARIALGKNLYAMLMGLRAVRSGAQRFAESVPHTGSREDYWPEFFTANVKEALTPSLQGAELLKGETLPPGERLYSPKLLDAWGDTPYEPITREDWLKDWGALDGISPPQSPYLCDISREHRLGILKTALAHDAVADEPT
ncbi:Protein of unknown function [Fontibacillus panacisegetis]|uniref:DUF2515 domain-containing protein n=1 Tax=Fontibacillus panacisegetis TaxID=670482 RepID=A0A1G7IMU6_9BACL|nr:DUF2515 family protein [Fontibacillus panacisegetis]SDF14070.1 Protein of unknown function [Fontibacillus panacisegetis]